MRDIISGRINNIIQLINCRNQNIFFFAILINFSSFSHSVRLIVMFNPLILAYQLVDSEWQQTQFWINNKIKRKQYPAKIYNAHNENGSIERSFWTGKNPTTTTKRHYQMVACHQTQTEIFRIVVKLAKFQMEKMPLGNVFCWITIGQDIYYTL